MNKTQTQVYCQPIKKTNPYLTNQPQEVKCLSGMHQANHTRQFRTPELKISANPPEYPSRRIRAWIRFFKDSSPLPQQPLTQAEAYLYVSVLLALSGLALDKKNVRDMPRAAVFMAELLFSEPTSAFNLLTSVFGTACVAKFLTCHTCQGFGNRQTASL